MPATNDRGAELDRTGRIREAPCMAHVWRKFVNLAHSQGGNVIAREAVERIAALYAVEAEARRKTPEEHVRIHNRSANRTHELMPWKRKPSP